VLDFGVKLDNYCSDMTRTVFFGKASNEEKKMYNTVLTAQEKAIEYIKTAKKIEAVKMKKRKTAFLQVSIRFTPLPKTVLFI
jgi:Xaa-Pro aminopeptidase